MTCGHLDREQEAGRKVWHLQGVACIITWVESLVGKLPAQDGWVIGIRQACDRVLACDDGSCIVLVRCVALRRVIKILQGNITHAEPLQTF